MNRLFACLFGISPALSLNSESQNRLFEVPDQPDRDVIGEFLRGGFADVDPGVLMRII